MAAPTTVKVYPLNGVARDFPIDFDYLAREFVVVALLGNDRRELVQNSEYTFPNATTIRTTSVWGSAQGYDNIEVRRVTSAENRLVTFNDASILRAADLNLAELQTVHIAQEARDLVSDALGTNDDGNLDARNRRIVNLGNPVDPQDAMTKDYYDSRVGEVKTWRDETKVWHDETLAFRDTTLGYKNAAAASAAAALVSEQNADTSEAQALSYKNAAAASAAAALTSEQNADASEAQALTYKNQAEAAAAIVQTIEDTANDAKAEAQAATAATTGLMDNDLTLFVNGTQRRDIKVKAGTHTSPGVQRAGVRFTDVDAVAVERYNQSTGVLIDTPVKIDQATGDVVLATKKIKGVVTPTAGDEAANKTYADTKLPLTGGSLSGALTLDGSGPLSPPLFLKAGAYSPHFRSNSTGSGYFEWLNGGNTAVIASLYNSGVLSLPFARPNWAGLTPWDTGNFDPSVKVSKDWITTAGLISNDLRRPYFRRESDGSLARMVSNNSSNTVEAGWDGGIRWYIDGVNMGRTVTDAQPWGFYHSASGRVGRSGDWVVSNGYFDVVIDGSSYGVPFNPSDARRKENIVPATEDVLAKVKQIKFYSFNFKPGGLMNSDKQYQTGFIAQQLLSVDPAFVYGDDNPEMSMSPDINSLLALSLKSVQVLTAMVEELQAQVAALKGNP